MNESEFKRIIGIFLASILLFVVLSPTAMLGMSYDTIITCVCVQSFTVVVLGRFYKKNR